MFLKFLLLTTVIWTTLAQGATIAIIDTGFDLDHDFLRPKIFKSETDEEVIDPNLEKKFHGWNFHDNTHLKKAVIDDQTALEEVLLFRTLRAKGHKEGLTPDEFEWFSKRNADKDFMEKVRQFKKHAHGTFVAGIALREGENINIFPIRGLHIPVPVVAVEHHTAAKKIPPKSRSAQEKFNEEINNSLDRISKKFNKICHYLSLRKIEVVNASYGITYKNIVTKFRETYKEHTGQEIDELRLQSFVNMYFEELYRRGERTIRRYPKMLFVFSAGNSGINNDEFHHYPSKIKLPNTISVAAINGEFLASFSNYGTKSVDIGAPGVAILSLLPKVYSRDGQGMYSPSSGTSMAAPYISNLAAQVMNTNRRLTPPQVKMIILETGEQKSHLKKKLLSGSLVNNDRALKAAALSREIALDEAINLARLDLVPMEDKISMNLAPAISADRAQKKFMNVIPQAVAPDEVDDGPSIDQKRVIKQATKSSSFSPKDRETGPQDKSDTPSSLPQEAPMVSADPTLSNQNKEQSPPPSAGPPASSSPPESSLPEGPPLDASPELPPS